MTFDSDLPCLLRVSVIAEINDMFHERELVILFAFFLLQSTPADYGVDRMSCHNRICSLMEF